MTLKPETDYFQTFNVSPYEQFRALLDAELLSQEKLRYSPNLHYV